MTEIYWITVVGALDTTFYAMWFLSAIGIMSLLIYSLVFCEKLNAELKNCINKWVIRILVFLFVGVVGDIITPSRKDMIMIYGLGGTIDYIKSRDKMKQIPQNVVDILTNYVDSIEKKEVINENQKQGI